MNKIFSKKLWTVLCVVMASLLVFVSVIFELAGRYAPLINATLKLETYYTVDDGDGSENTNYFPALYDNEQKVKEYAEKVCEDIESEGLVLLKNDDALPLAKGAKVSLFMTGAVEINCSAQGLRNAADKTAYPTLKEALEAEQIAVNGALWDFYENKTTGSKTSAGVYGGYRMLNESTGLQTGYINEMPFSEFTPEIKNTFSAYGNAAVAVITRDATEGSDAVTVGSDGANGNYLALSVEELDVLKELTLLRNGGVFDYVIVLLNSALPVQLDFMLDENVRIDAAMWIGNTGMSGINAVAKALSGTVNPSGRLTDTFVYDNSSSPVMKSWTMSESKAFSESWNDKRLSGNAETTQKYYGVYTEGIYVGYRYYETRYTDMVEGAYNVGIYDYETTVAYPFGHGLSYTEFAYSDFAVQESADGKSIDVSVKVTNTGSVPGKETVQIYLQKPYTDYAAAHAMEVAAVELCGFGKTGELAVGGSETVEIKIDKREFASFDVYGAGTYVLDTGKHYVTAAKNAHDAANNILAVKGYDTSSGMDALGDEKAVAVAFDNNTFDSVTFSKSGETGNDIKASLGAGDINRYDGAGENTVTYVSRSDWENTMPQKAATIVLTDAMARDLQNVDIDDIDGTASDYTFGANNGLTLAMLRGKDTESDDWNKLIDQMSFDELNTLLTTCISQTPMVTSVSKPQTKEMDGPTYCKEGKTGSRFPCEGIWAASFNLELIGEVGAALANDARLVGYSGMWIPGINIHRSPYGGRNHEYFSEDPFLTGMAAEAEIKELQKYGVIAQPKHYVFNEQEINRGGIGVWLNEQAAREIFIEPWKYAVAPSRGNAHALMTAFNRFGTKWVSADKELMNILRDEFGFDGYVITDMADAIGTQYMTALDGILAGTDCWLSSDSHSFAAYKNNKAVVGKMREAAKRILFTVGNYSAAMNGYSTTMRNIPIATWWEILLITLVAVFAVFSATSIVMLVLSEIKSNRSKI